MPRPNVSEQRKQEIVLAAAQVFNRDGLAAARMEDVAVAAGISKGTIYLYYPGKEALIEALLRAVFQPLDESLARFIAETTPVPARLLAYADDVLAAFIGATDLHPLTLELFALSRRQETAGQLFSAYFVTYRDAVAAVIAEGAARGELDARWGGEANARAGSILFMSALEGLLVLTMINPAVMNLATDGTATMRAVIAALVGGIRSAP